MHPLLEAVCVYTNGQYYDNSLFYSFNSLFARITIHEFYVIFSILYTDVFIVSDISAYICICVIAYSNMFVTLICVMVYMVFNRHK